MDWNWNATTEVIIAIVGIITIGKILYDIATKKQGNLRDEYKFSKEFLDDTNLENLHPFTLEKGYQALAGSSIAKKEEIIHILSLENPIQCLNDFKFSRNLVELNVKSNNLLFKFKEQYSLNFSRLWRKILYAVLYIILVVFSLSPLLTPVFNSFFNTDLLTRPEFLFATFPVGIFYAWTSLNTVLKIKRAEFLVKNQSPHTKHIISDK